MSNNQAQQKYWLAFNQVKSLGPVRWQKLLNYFPDLSEAWSATSQEFRAAGLEPKIVEDLISQRRQINPDQEWEKIEKLGCTLVTIKDKNYPPLLKEIYAPPPLLYCFGQLALDQKFPLAVVGSRKISSYGEKITRQLVGELAAAGLTIVSGLAFGVDTVAHQATLAVGGKTIAVLGSSLDNIYPAANYQLAQKIIDSGGAVISEFALGTVAYKSNFPQRNRIIAGLSLGVLITEAGEKSGALITANYALEQNREVFAVPGDIYRPTAAGTNKLIKAGAKTTTSLDDILETLNLQNAKQFQAAQIIMPETETEKILLAFLADEPLSIDKLAQVSRLDISTVNSALAVMELKGLVKNLGQHTYAKTR